MEGKNGYSSCYCKYNEVFVERVSFPEYSDVEKHYWKEFAGFGEDEGYIVDMGEGSISEWGG